MGSPSQPFLSKSETKKDVCVLVASSSQESACNSQTVILKTTSISIICEGHPPYKPIFVCQLLLRFSHLNHPLWLGFPETAWSFTPFFWGENPWLNHPWFSSIKKERFRCLRPGLTTVWIYKHPVNNGISTTCPSTGAGLLHQQYSFSRLLNQILEKKPARTLGSTAFNINKRLEQTLRAHDGRLKRPKTSQKTCVEIKVPIHHQMHPEMQHAF